MWYIVSVLNRCLFSYRYWVSGPLKLSQACVDAFVVCNELSNSLVLEISHEEEKKISTLGAIHLVVDHTTVLPFLFLLLLVHPVGFMFVL